MYRLSPRRSHRSKGFKVKHILQICLLLAVCFWLIYQVKRSHEKRKEFDAKDEIFLDKMQTDGEIQRFGRKDLPRVTEIATNDEKHLEDDEEKEVEEEENKNEEEETEREDIRTKDREEEDEVDENEPEKTEHEDEDELEKSETEAKHEEEQVDEDRGKEENETANHIEKDDVEEEDEEHSESEENKVVNNNHPEVEQSEDNKKEDHTDHDVASDSHVLGRDNDGSSTNTQVAREEQYKADDASSEVALNIQTTIHETDNATTGHANGVANNETISINSTNVSEDSSLQNSTLPADEQPNLVGNESEHVNKSNQTANDENQSGYAAGSNRSENVYTDGVESKIPSNNTTSALSHEMTDSDTMSTKVEKSENVSEDDGNTIQHDPIDASDVTLTEEEKELRTVMGTLPLPEIRNEVQ